MRRRLYFLLPDLDTASKIHDELLLARIEERHMHYLAKEGTELSDLPQATLLQRSDLIHGLQIGLIYGGITGIFAGLISIQLLELSIQSGGVVVLGVALLGCLVGAWASSMVAVGAPNLRLQRFEQPLAEGQILLMVDVAKERVDEVTALIKGHHPDADAHGIEPTIPAFP